jgi:hypothetical protein
MEGVLATRFPTIMAEMEWFPEQMIAFMVRRVDKVVLQSGVYGINYRDYLQIIEKGGRPIYWDRVDYDIEKSEAYRGEIENSGCSLRQGARAYSKRVSGTARR